MAKRVATYAAARARRVLRGGCVSVVMVNRRSWGVSTLEGHLADGGRWWGLTGDGESTLVERLRLARRYNWTLLRLFEDYGGMNRENAPWGLARSGAGV